MRALGIFYSVELWRAGWVGGDLDELVERAGIHVLHAIIYAGLDEKCAVKVYDLWGDGSMEDVEFHNDGIEFGLVEFETDFLADN